MCNSIGRAAEHAGGLQREWRWSCGLFVHRRSASVVVSVTESLPCHVIREQVVPSTRYLGGTSEHLAIINE
jgi:hypothetical protein